jgi:hypothetical protein
MNTNSTDGGHVKAPQDENSVVGRGLTPAQQYLVRSLARRARISLPHALLAAHLAGIVREVRHG